MRFHPDIRLTLGSMLAACATVLLACGPRDEAPRPADSVARPPSVPGALSRYDLSAAPTWETKLPKALTEISGLAFAPDGRLFAQGDQDATIWQLDAPKGKVLKTFTVAATGHDPDLGKKQRGTVLTGDFEDITIVGDRFFLIASNGVLVEFKQGADGASVPYTARDTGLGARCEIEGLTYDPGSNALLILCKNPHDDAWKKQIVVLSWSLTRGALDPAPRIRVDVSRVAALTHADIFHGSAFALAPDRNSLVLIAGPQQTYLELSVAGAVRSGGALDAGAHRQPEGIAFAPDGTLLISDEGAGKRATLSGYAPKP